MSSLAARALALLCLCLALVASGYFWGRSAANDHWQAQQAKAGAAVQKEIQKETQRADEAAASYLTEHLNQEDRYAILDAKYQKLRSRAPLFVPRPVVVAVCPSSPPPALAGPALGASGDSGPVLTLAAVRLWNGALTGVDSPAGACGLAGAAEGTDAADSKSCSASAGLALDDAWDNHTTNARSCAEDRQRYRALIDYLKNQPQGD